MEDLTIFIEQLVNKRVDQLLSKIINKKFDDLERQFDVIIPDAIKIKPSDVTTPEMLTIRQAAVYHNKSVASIRNYAKTGRIPSVKKDGIIFFLKQDLDKSMEPVSRLRSAQRKREKRVEDWIGNKNSNSQVLPMPPVM